MSDLLWYRRPDAAETCNQCRYLLHSPAHDHMHRGWIEYQVARFRRQLGAEDNGQPHLHLEPRTRPPLGFLPPRMWDTYIDTGTDDE